MDQWTLEIPTEKGYVFFWWKPPVDIAGREALHLALLEGRRARGPAGTRGDPRGPGFSDQFLLGVVTMEYYRYLYWLVVWNINFIFPYIGNVIIPIDVQINQRGSNHQPV